MEKAGQHIQNKYIRNAYILQKWNDMCNADVNELYEIACLNVKMERNKC